MPNLLPKSVLFISGAFISHTCWDEWKRYFESNGYSCMVPVWPFKEASPEDLRNKPPDDIMASIRLTMLHKHFERILDELPEKPILIGHSMGGLMVQLLLQRGLGSAGVAMHSFPPACVTGYRLTLLQSLWDSMGLFTSKRKTYLVSFRKWKNVFANGMSCDEQKALYYTYAIPESKLLISDLFTAEAKINFKKQHAPLLFTSGSVDKLIPAGLNYNNYKKYSARNSITTYMEFKNSNHLVFDPPSLQEEAEYTLQWLAGIKQTHHF